MRVQGIGELTEHDTHWHLTHDDCGHVQVFALEGLDDPEAAVFLVRRLYAKCPTCALANTAVAAETPTVEPNQFHLVLGRDGLAAIVAAVAALRVVGLAALAERLDAILPRSSRPP
jgi:hypothetical protein